ncbi:trehalose-phosphatase [Occultella glacieicola]|uniref:Trehalose 6-phosphate phosphatase n=1 Tax=Occultella glacieicola TaxID=2518684 RepID=A0ABY2E3L1_9MICO|nr:trehalose-phosphatase [Occultella glacieicola]TDE94214.1 trehalose-phosphatase [Occultella glacieicola]
MDESLTAALADFAASSPILIALDFDGCLAPFERDPANSRPLPESATALARLGTDPGVQLALVSGRPAADLLALASPPAGTWLVGSHGGQTGEVRADGTLHLDAFELTTAQAELLGAVTEAMAEVADAHPGAWVERKPAAAALHTRGLDPAAAEAALAAAMVGPGTWPGVHPILGNQVAELAVLEVTKGQALERLRARPAREATTPTEASSAVGRRVLYAGDDVTDETALATLRDGDLGVKVGAAPSVAAHRVPDERGVARMLTDLADRRVTRNTP